MSSDNDSSLVNSYLKQRFLNLLETIMADGPSKVPRLSRFDLIKNEILCDDNVWSDILSLSSISSALRDLTDVLTQCRVFAYKHDIAIKKRLLWLYFATRKALFVRKMGHRLDQIEKNLKDAKESRNPMQELQPYTQRRKVVSEIVGFDVMASKIKELLIDKSKEGFAAIAIFGMGGSGKTTLAEKVFDIMKEEFDDSIWVCLPKASDLSTNDLSEDVVKAILKAAGYNLDESEAELGVLALLEKLKRRLKGRRYLIVLDDVWSVDDSYEDLGYEVEDLDDNILEDKLSHALPKGSGGVVIVTSRLEDTSKKMVGSKNVIHLDSLGDELCRSIFEHALNGKGIGPNELQIVEKMKNEIIENCHGLPLAANALAEIIALRIRELK